MYYILHGENWAFNNPLAEAWCSSGGGWHTAWHRLLLLVQGKFADQHLSADCTLRSIAMPTTVIYVIFPICSC